MTKIITAIYKNKQFITKLYKNVILTSIIENDIIFYTYLDNIYKKYNLRLFILLIDFNTK